MKKVLFIDRDGTLIREPADEQIDSFAKLEFLPGVFTYLGRIARELDYTLVMVTNQDGLGTDSFPEDTFWPVHNFIVQTLEGEGIRFAEELIDRSFPHENQPTRKPGTAMMTHYLKGGWDLAQSYVLGDRLSDVQLAKNLGCGAIFIGQGAEDAALNTENWAEIYAFLKGQPRRAVVNRATRETEIRIVLDLDGTGRANISTGLGFFDHMLDQVARHGGVDLDIQVKGDLEVDEHHTIEDTA
ncbi:MAG: histidinol-phosphatase, partial [Bacteroidota bacterium]